MSVIHIEQGLNKEGRTVVYCTSAFTWAIPWMYEPLRDALKRTDGRCEDCMKAVSTLEILRETVL